MLVVIQYQRKRLILLRGVVLDCWSVTRESQSRKASELLGVLRVGVSINSCDVKSDDMENLASPIDRKALLRTKFPKVFQGLGKLKGYQLKLHIDENVQPVAQPVCRIPFSRRAKVTEKLEELLKLDVIEKVEGPTSWVNPLAVVEKPNGHQDRS